MCHAIDERQVAAVKIKSSDRGADADDAGGGSQFCTAGAASSEQSASASWATLCGAVTICGSCGLSPPLNGCQARVGRTHTEAQGHRGVSRSQAPPGNALTGGSCLQPKLKP